MDNFDLTKYLAEGKLFEEDFKNPILDKYLELKKSIDYKTVFPTDLQSFLDSLDNTEREGLKRDLAEGKLLKENMSLEVDDDFIELSADSGEYSGDLNDDGTVDFSVVYDDGTEFDDSTWKSILGPKHAFVKISKKIPTKVEAAGDYVMITVDLEDLKNLLK